MLDYTLSGRVAVLTMRRPEVRNAVNGELAAAIEAGIDRLEGDDEAWVGVLAGEGPVFSAGADLRSIASGDVLSLQTDRGGFAGITRRSRSKPIIAAVDGPALAGGCEIVLACDLVVASTAAVFGLPEVKRCMVAAAGGPFRLATALPRAVAMEMVLTGDPLPAARAHALGMVNELVEPGQALEGALRLAARIVASSPAAVRESRELLVSAGRDGEEELWTRSAEAFARVAASEDFVEGLRAFAEGRAPVWQAR
ncbi:MAG: crotonase/enoyl-CoA hydratase family protein [Acidimicrobiales bacterium]